MCQAASCCLKNSSFTMRCAAAFLPLLLCLYWTRAQGESGKVMGNDITQTEVQSDVLCVKATTCITTDIWAELKALRDMVIEHNVEFKNSKTEIEKLEQENTDIQARLTASETKNAVLEARMNSSENVVKELKIENIVLRARMSTSEKEVEELKRENTDLLARVSACDNKSTVLEARMSSSENEVKELKRENTDRPKVAFSLGLTDAGQVGPFDTDITLKFSKVFTNFGQGYSPATGIFTAPVKGAYYFRFTAWEERLRSWIGVNLYHNDTRVTWNSDCNDEYGRITVTNALVLQLEKGDAVYLVLPSGHGVWDDTYDRTTFSGFLLFPL
ncbi:hypothetical protein PAMA_008669 [Pampus argenteus]